MGEETICGFPADHVVLGMTVKDLRTMIRDSFLLLVVFLVWALVGVFFDWAFDVRDGSGLEASYFQYGKESTYHSNLNLDWFRGACESYTKTDSSIKFVWGKDEKKNWPFGKYDYDACVQQFFVNDKTAKKFGVEWRGRIHVGGLPSYVDRITFTIESDGQMVQMGRVANAYDAKQMSGTLDRWIARPPGTPGVICTQLPESQSSDPADHQICPQHCLACGICDSLASSSVSAMNDCLNNLGCKNGTQADMFEVQVNPRLTNIDVSPTIWLHDCPIQDTTTNDLTCDRCLYGREYVDIVVQYMSTAVYPHISLNWEGPDLPYGPVPPEYLFQRSIKTFGDHMTSFSFNKKTGTIFTVCLGFATMWIVGEFIFIRKKRRDKLGEKEERKQILEEIKANNQGKELSDDTTGIMMGNMPVSEYKRQWAQDLGAWERRKKAQTDGATTFFGCTGHGLFMYLMHFGMGTAVIALFLSLAPPAPSASDTHSGLRSLSFYVNPFGDLGAYGAYDFICFGALILENLLFLWAILEIDWPTRGSRHQLLEAMEKTDITRMSGGSRHEVALLIACHRCDCTLEKRQGLQDALHAALDVFPASHIFICDNAREAAPPDETWRLVEDTWAAWNNKQIEKGEAPTKERINYIYLPVGNKTIAFFWVLDSWIPMLEEQGLCPKFKYIMMIDDDVCIPETIQFPLKQMDMETDIQAIAYGISAVKVDEARQNTRHYLDNMIVAYQNLEYLLAGFFKQLQSSYGTTLACHGAIALWKRPILVSQILWNHDCIFNGEDLQMGLILHSMKAGYKIKHQPRELVHTAPPDYTLMLWQQRVKSWDVTSHRMTLNFIKILLFQWCGGLGTLVLKPFFLLEVFNIFQDWVRIFFFAYLFTYPEGQIHLVQWVFFLIALEWILLVVWHVKCLKHRPDLKNPLLVYFLYPLVYKPLSQLFRWYALLENIVRYSPYGPTGQLVREKVELGLLPPAPDFAKTDPTKVDWRTIWAVEPEDDEDDEIRSTSSQDIGRRHWF